MTGGSLAKTSVKIAKKSCKFDFYARSQPIFCNEFSLVDVHPRTQPIELDMGGRRGLEGQRAVPGESSLLRSEQHRPWVVLAGMRAEPISKLGNGRSCHGS
jgi:hypothetical protein